MLLQKFVQMVCYYKIRERLLLIKPTCISYRDKRELCVLVRYRRSLFEERTREVNRL